MFSDFKKEIEFDIKRWYKRLPFNKKILLVVSIIVFLLIYRAISVEIGWFTDIEEKLRNHFDDNKSLICKNQKHKDLINKANGWIFSNEWFFLFNSLSKVNIKNGNIYKFYKCKRLEDNNKTIIPNHMYTKLDEKIDDYTKNQKSWFDKYIYDINENIWTPKDDLFDEFMRLMDIGFKIDNQSHIELYEKLFNLGQTFECQEDKINKEFSWKIIKENNISYFSNSSKKYSFINCDIDDFSSW